MITNLKTKLKSNVKINTCLFVFSFFLIAFISIGFSALQQDLMITGDVNYEAVGSGCSTFYEDDWATVLDCLAIGYDGYNVGDTKTIPLTKSGTTTIHTVRILNNSNYDCTLDSKTACGFVLGFADIVGFRTPMDYDSSSGGWPASKVRPYLNDESDPNSIINSLPEVVRNAIIDTTVVSAHTGTGLSGGHTNYVTTDKLYLPSVVEVTGENYNRDNVKLTQTRQFDYYAMVGSTPEIKSTSEGGYSGDYWIYRSPYAPSRWIVNKNQLNGGGVYEELPTRTGNVAPIFRLYSPSQPDSCSDFKNDSWATIVSNVQNGNTKRYPAGCEKPVTLSSSLGTHTLRVGNNSTPPECSITGFSQSACGFVLEFMDIVSTEKLTASGNYGSLNATWGNSALRNYINSVIYNALPTELKNAVIDTYTVSGRGNTDLVTSTDKLYLLEFLEIDGLKYNYSGLTLSNSRQLDAYKRQIVINESYASPGTAKKNNGTISSWWLRKSTTYNWGVWAYDDAKKLAYPNNYQYGFSPAFRIAE